MTNTTTPIHQLSDIEAVAHAMRMWPHHPTPYQDEEIVKAIQLGQIKGWVRRPSTTQVEWTEAGVEAVKAARAPVDVLAALERQARYLDREKFENAARHMREARDAVSDLIQAGNEMLRVSSTQGITDDEYWRAVQKLDAALANVQGEA